MQAETRTVAADERTPMASGESISDLIRFIGDMEEYLAQSRNELRRRSSVEPLAPGVAVELAKLAANGADRAKTARKRYRSLEATLIRVDPDFKPTEQMDWRQAADAALKIALAEANHSPLSFSGAIEILTTDELEAYCSRRLHAAKRPAK